MLNCITERHSTTAQAKHFTTDEKASRQNYGGYFSSGSVPSASSDWLELAECTRGSGQVSSLSTFSIITVNDWYFSNHKSCSFLWIRDSSVSIMTQLWDRSTVQFLAEAELFVRSSASTMDLGLQWAILLGLTTHQECTKLYPRSSLQLCAELRVETIIFTN
jgi:hypothetical protein